MPVPSPRNPILPARGNYADLLANVAALSDGEICYAIDQDTIYMKEGSSLVPVSSSGGAVTSVAGKTGNVTLVKADITDFSDSDYATGAEGDLATTATQPGDNVSTLTNDAGYLTSVPSQELDDLTDVNAPTPSNGQFLQWNGSAWVPGAASGAPVDSVNGQTGIVVLDADDISDTSTTNKFATQTELDKLAGIEAGATADQTPAEIKADYESNLDTNAFTDAEKTKLAGIAAGAEVNAVDSVAGKTGIVTLVKADITDFADGDYATAAQGVAADSATQPGDNVSTLTNDSGYITSAGAPVQSVNTQTGAVVLDADDIDDTATTNKFATAAQLSAADSALQPADIGVTVQGYDATLLNSADIGVTVQAYDANLPAGNTILVDGDIGSTVQGYDADLAALAALSTTGLISRTGAGTASTVTAPSGDLVGTTATQTLTNKTLTDPAIIGTILEDVYTISDGADFEIDPGNGSIQLITLGANRTPKATNFAAGEAVTLMVDDGSAYTLTWSDTTFGTSGVVWKTGGGTAPTLNTTGFTVITFWKVGTQVYGARVGDS
jgi:hypothetical protein